MHHIDRPVDEMEFLNEYEQEFNNESESEYEGEFQEAENEDEYSGEQEEEYSGEYENEYSGEYEGETESESESEVMEMELATELLSVNNEEELEQFLGKLFKKVKSSAGKFIKSPAGGLLKKYLKTLAQKALPIAGTALGGIVGGPIGAKLGSSATQMVGKALGLELEGLSPEDKEYEVAKGYVRFAKDAIHRTASNPRHRHSPRSITRSSMINAAKKHAPGFLSPSFANNFRRARRRVTVRDHRYNGAGENGTWSRQEDGSVILYGL